MIVTKDCYNITDLVLQTAPQNETEVVWATITLKTTLNWWYVLFTDSKIKGSPQLSEITDTFRNNPKTTLILGGDFNAGGY